MELSTKLSRRSFLLGAAVGSAAVVWEAERMTSQSAVPAKRSEHVRHHISEHIRNYWDAASATQSQAFTLIGALFLLPITFMYTGWSYWVFRGKVRGGISILSESTRAPS